MNKIKGYIFGIDLPPTQIPKDSDICKATLDIAIANHFIVGYLYLTAKEEIE